MLSVPAFFQFLLPLLGVGGGAAAGAGLLSGVLTAVGVGSQLAAANRQKKAAKAQSAAIAASEVKSQQAFRDNLRAGGSGQGTGDFKAPASGSFDTALKTITGRQ